jgi:hypothetical protein
MPSFPRWNRGNIVVEAALSDFQGTDGFTGPCQMFIAAATK